MEIQKKGNTIIIRKILKSNETYKIQKKKKFESIYFYKKPQICKGFSSKTSDGKHILLLDYDEVEFEVVREDIKFLQEHYQLPSAYVFSTKFRKDKTDVIGNFHAIFLSKHSSSEIMQLMKETHIDTNFIDSPIRNVYRSWVLRIGNKNGSGRPKWYATLGSGYLDTYEISCAHLSLIKKLYPNIDYYPNYKNLDELKEVKIQEYETA